MIADQLARNTPQKLSLIYGNRHDHDIIYQKDWEQLGLQTANFRALFTLSRPSEQWTGARGYVQDQIEKFIPQPKDNDYYICGLSPMINAVQAKLVSLGVPENQIHFEKYD